MKRRAVFIGAGAVVAVVAFVVKLANEANAQSKRDRR